MDNLLSEKEASEKLNISLTTLRRLRYSGKGPDYIKIGRRIVYRLDFLDKYVELKTMKGKNK